MDTAHQVAALIVRRTTEGSPLILLVTSRDTRRWVIPKGWPQQDQPDHVTASQEALEEGGVIGVVLPGSIGSYLYRKRLPTETIDVRVRVFMLNFAKAIRGNACGVHRQWPPPRSPNPNCNS
jgi:8-oxo-dGTP pyrophosphatase MutT (NUDIX family)